MTAEPRTRPASSPSVCPCCKRAIRPGQPIVASAGAAARHYACARSLLKAWLHRELAEVG